MGFETSMENGVVLETDLKIQSQGFSDLNVNGSSLFQRKIEFRLAKNPTNGFSNGEFLFESLNPSSKSPKKGATAGHRKTDGSEFSDSGLDPELCFGFTLRKIGAGLENLGNTCFLNSVLQCLTYTEPLAAYLQSGKHQNSCRIAGFCALCAIQKHVSRALQSSGRILAPKDLVSNLRCISRSFRNARQEDAHEYMVNLLESMHKCCLPSGVPSESPSAYEKSLVHKIFGGSLRSQVKCLQCSYCSNKFDPFLDLSLEIAKADSLYKALKNFTAAEYLDGGERQYNCQQCKQKVRATKQLTVHKAPYVLSIHLKRFHAYDPGQKINKKVQFDSTLNLKPFVSGSYEGDLKYTLYGVLVHYGWSTHSGHYYCFVRTSSGTWYSLDDNRVVSVSEKTVLEQKAYMLFYVRDKSSFGLRKSTKITQKENTKTNVSVNGICSMRTQNGEKEKKVEVSKSSSTKDTLDVESTSKNNGSGISESLLAKSDPVLHSSSKEQTVKDPLKRIPNLTSDDGSLSLSSAISMSCNGSVPQNSEDFNMETAKKGEGCPGILGTQKNPDISAINSLDSDEPRASNVDKSPIDGTFQKSNAGSSKDQEVLDEVEEMKMNKSPSKQNSDSIQVEGPINVKATSDSFFENDAKIKMGPVPETTELSKPLKMLDDCLVMKASASLRHRKLKKLPSGDVVSMRLSTVILFRSSVGIRKKKKHKKTKCRKTYTSNLILKPSLDDNATDMEPSTSEKIISLGTTHPKRKRDKSPSEKEVKETFEKETKEYTKKPPRNVMDTAVRGRNVKGGAVLASDGQSHYNSCSTGASSQCDARESSSSKDCGRGKEQNVLMGMLTRGLEETLVARWDNMDSPTQKFVESNCREDIKIGYVVDEWDQEYDRGKRKKLSSSLQGFGLNGRNYFQEIANRKSQLKKTKADQYSTGNTPYRI